jgi:hypothetical protein
MLEGLRTPDGGSLLVLGLDPARNGDALRQTMVGGIPFAPLWVDFMVLALCLVVFYGVSSRFFRWQ